MSFTLTVPTWSTIKDMILLVVAYYSLLVAPEYDWAVFGVAYYFGCLVALRSWWRLKRPYSWGLTDWELYVIGAFTLCLFWPLSPFLGLSKWFVLFGNKRGKND